VFEEALRLPEKARAALARELLESLEREAIDPDRDEQWAAEIRRRLDAYERGETQAVPVADVFARMAGMRVRAPVELTPEQVAQLENVVEVDAEAYVRWIETGEGPDPAEAAFAKLRSSGPITAD
jgi:putative addiction module component (TIGR02574 family)